MLYESQDRQKLLLKTNNRFSIVFVFVFVFVFVLFCFCLSHPVFVVFICLFLVRIDFAFCRKVEFCHLPRINAVNVVFSYGLFRCLGMLFLFFLFS